MRGNIRKDKKDSKDVVENGQYVVYSFFSFFLEAEKKRRCCAVVKENLSLLCSWSRLIINECSFCSTLAKCQRFLSLGGGNLDI